MMWALPYNRLSCVGPLTCGLRPFKLSHVTMNPEKNVKMYTMTSGIKLIAIFKHQYLTFIEKKSGESKE